MEAVNALGMNIESVMDPLTRWVVEAIPNLIAAALIFVVGLAVARWAARQSARLVDRSERIDNTLRGAVRAVVAYAISTIAIIAALGQLGFQTTSLLAALGAIGLAVGLALQGTLSNIAAGFMLLWLHPFRLGDYIETDAASGTIREVGLFATEIESWDGVYHFVPNSELWNRRITNFSRLQRRLVEVKIGISYDDDIAEAKAVLMRVASRDDRTLDVPAAPSVFVDSLADSAVILSLRVWAASGDYWALRRTLTEKAKIEIDAAGISIPYPQIRLHGSALATQRAEATSA